MLYQQKRCDLYSMQLLYICDCSFHRSFGNALGNCLGDINYLRCISRAPKPVSIICVYACMTMMNFCSTCHVQLLTICIQNCSCVFDQPKGCLVAANAVRFFQHLTMLLIDCMCMAILILSVPICWQNIIQSRNKNKL